jgi:hypothetical protein
MAPAVTSLNSHCFAVEFCSYRNCTVNGYHVSRNATVVISAIVEEFLSSYLTFSRKLELFQTINVSKSNEMTMILLPRKLDLQLKQFLDDEPMEETKTKEKWPECSGPCSDDNRCESCTNYIHSDEFLNNF